MARWQGTTTERGLGADHVASRKRLLAALQDGDPCWRCGQPMYHSQDLDRDHIIDRIHGGKDGPAVLAHRSCNRAAGARLGNQTRRQGIRGLAAPRGTCQICGQQYHRPSRSCEVCGQHYHPTYGEQRACGRACGWELRRLGKGQRSARPNPHVTVWVDAFHKETMATSRNW